MPRPVTCCRNGPSRERSESKAMMENTLIWLGWGICGLLAAPLVLGTPLVKQTHWIAKRAQLKKWESNCDPQIQNWLESQAPIFAELGFEFVCHGALEDFTPQVNTYFALFRHPEAGLAATASWIASGQKQIKYTEFSQLFSDGSSLNVNNSEVSLTWHLPEKLFFRLPWQSDHKRLFELHQWIRRQKYPDKIGKHVEPGKELQTVNEFMFHEGQALVKSGAYQNGADPKHLVLTWPGAINAVWANSFPGKQLFAFQELGQSRRLEKEFGQSQQA